MARVRLGDNGGPPLDDDESIYPPIPKITSGSFLLDKVLGGGWACGRVSNIVGDRSAGKSLLAFEAMANFAVASDAENCRLAEIESALDRSYAKTVGLPDGIQLTDEIETVEQMEKDLAIFCAAQTKKKDSPAGIYVIDSLDALSDDAEMERETGAATYGTAKAKNMSTMFRKKIATIDRANVHLMVISQIRDNIGVTFGETKKRSGGRALDFYCSQVIWIADIGKIKKTVKGVEMIIGSNVRARCKKNKVGMPHREVDIEVIYNYGVDDESSMINYLKKHKDADVGDRTVEQWRRDMLDLRKQRDRSGLRQLNKKLRKLVGAHWDAVEDAVRPTMSKYG